MIDQWNDDRTGWARFSDDMTMRYRMAKSLDGRPLQLCGSGVIECERCVTFCLLNPSVADAFKPDPTTKRCAVFARGLGADVYQVVNIAAYISTDRSVLKRLTHGNRGDGPDNDREILIACQNSWRVIAGWGKDGALDHRGEQVRRMLRHHVALYAMGVNKDGSPKHPLYIRGCTQPELWS